MFSLVLLSYPLWAAAPAAARLLVGPKPAAVVERWARPCWSALLFVGPAWFGLVDGLFQLTWSYDDSVFASIEGALDGSSPARGRAGLRWLLATLPLLGVWLSLRLARRWSCGAAGPALLVAAAPYAFLLGLVLTAVEPAYGAAAAVLTWTICAWARGRARPPAPATGVDLGAVAVVVAGSTCRICGERIEAEAVQCDACATPHHRSCWDWNGGCATYACGGRRTG